MNKENNEIKTQFDFKPTQLNHPFEVPKTHNHSLLILGIAIVLLWASIISILIIL